MQLVKKTHTRLDNVDSDEEDIGYEYPTRANNHIVCGKFFCIIFFLGIMVGFALSKQFQRDLSIEITELEKRVSELETHNCNLFIFLFCN